MRSAAELDNKSFIIELIEKWPNLDQSWSEEIKQKWRDGYHRLIDWVSILGGKRFEWTIRAGLRLEIRLEGGGLSEEEFAFIQACTDRAMAEIKRDVVGRKPLEPPAPGPEAAKA